MREKNFLALLFAISLAIKIPLALFFVKGFGVDETLYLSLARKFAEAGEYGIKTEFYDMRFVAPLWPTVLAFVYGLGGELAARFLSPIISSLTLVPFYYLGKKFLSKTAASYVALFFLFNPAAILLSTRMLTENLALLLFTIAIILLLDTKKNKWKLVPFAVFAASAGITRYPLLLHSLTIFLAFVFLTKKFDLIANRFFFLSIATTLLVLSPWFIFNLENFGNILGGPLHQASGDAGFVIAQAVLYFPYLLIILGPLFPFVFVGAKYLLDRKQIVLPMLFLVFFFTQFFVLGKVAEERYLFPILPFAGLLVGVSLEKFLRSKWKQLVTTLFVFLLAIGFLGGIYLVNLFGNLPRYVEMKQAVLWAKENCTAPIVSNGFTYVWYYAEFENIPLLNKEKTIELVSARNVECIIFTPYEPFSENFLPDVEDFEPTKSFGKVLIYKVKL